MVLFLFVHISRWHFSPFPRVYVLLISFPFPSGLIFFCGILLKVARVSSASFFVCLAFIPVRLFKVQVVCLSCVSSVGFVCSV